MIHRYITMTGIDVKTDIEALPKCVEYGILYSANPRGRNRYPSRGDISSILLRMCSFSTSLHVCGSLAQLQLLNGELGGMTDYVQRIQVNGIVLPEILTDICSNYPDHEIITQYNPSNTGLLDAPETNHSLLVDGSGGNGVAPSDWIRPDTRKKVGFAGGIGPDNIYGVWSRICLVATGSWWIDMETSLRDDDDWFSITKVRQVLKGLIPIPFATMPIYMIP